MLNRENDIERAPATPHPHRIEIYKIERSYHIYIYIYGAGDIDGIYPFSITTK